MNKNNKPYVGPDMTIVKVQMQSATLVITSEPAQAPRLDIDDTE